MSLSKMQLELEVDRSLRRFAEALKPSEEYHDTGVRLCEKVLITIGSAVAKNRLSGGNTFSIPFVYYSGTINTINDPNPTPLEFDVLIKIANRQPPYADVLDFVDTTLRNNAFRLQIAPRTIKLTTYMVQFSFTNGISVTIIAGSSDLSQEEVVRQIKGDCTKYRRYYSSNLMDKQIDFIKSQSFYAQKVGRLAKFWYHNMDIEETSVVGGAVMFDLLAIAAVLEEEAKGHGREAVLRAFSRVVELTENLEGLALGFEREYGQYGPWKVKTFINNSIDSGRMPRLTEPNNPKMNILHGISPKAVEGLQRNARAMRLRISQLVENQEFCEVTDSYGSGDNGGESIANAKRQKVCIQFAGLFGAADEPTNNNV